MSAARFGRSGYAVALVLAAIAAGCGSDDPASSPAGAEIQASDPAERQIAVDVQDYLLYNCPRPGEMEKVRKRVKDSASLHQYERYIRGAEALCGRMAAIEVEGERVTIRSDVEDDATGRAAGEAFCLLIMGSDVADTTPGHELQGLEGETIESCPGEVD